jgi:hypothetical protein
MLNNAVRVLALIAGGSFFLGGLAEVVVRGGDAGTGVFGILVGSVVMAAAVLQQSRYRSEAAERNHDEPGPGGGESGYMEPRFLPTGEVFGDPTSRRLMRVYIDPRTGERRYRAEG